MTIYDLFYTDVLSDTLYYLCLKTEQVIAVRGNKTYLFDLDRFIVCSQDDPAILTMLYRAGVDFEERFTRYELMTLHLLEKVF
jgi:hypothetical protein